MCDICLSAEETLQLTPSDMQGAVNAGFDPFTTRLVDEVTIDQWSDDLYGQIYDTAGPNESKDFTPAYQAALRKWKRDLVDTDTSPWRFCTKCATSMRQFTAHGSGVKHSAAEIRAQQNMIDLVFGSTAPAPKRKWWRFWET